MNLIDKFARVAALRPARRRESLLEATPEPLVESLGESLIDRRGEDHSRALEDEDRLARILGAQVQQNRYGQYLSVKRWYDKPEMCAPTSRALSLLLPQGPIDKKTFEAALDPEQWLFLDTETTGLSGGTGTYAFLIGLAWWDAGGLQVEQFCMRDLDEEHSLLLELSERMRQRSVLVTFNGKTFDWPLLETRYRMTRSIAAFPFTAHLDLLHPARHLWRPRLGSVRLRDLELHALGGIENTLGWTRDDDIDSSLIPQMYFDYLRGRPADPLAGVFRHNQMDLRGLAALAAKMIAMLDPAAHTVVPLDEELERADAELSAVHHPIDLYGLSKLLHRRGERSRARTVCESALMAGLPQDVKRLAQRDLALLAKRERDYARANALWESLSDSQPYPAGTTIRLGVSGSDAIKAAVIALETAIEAAEQLAMHYEHRIKQPQRAAAITQGALAELSATRNDGLLPEARARKIENRLHRRLARLTRRCGILAPQPQDYAETS